MGVESVDVVATALSTKIDLPERGWPGKMVAQWEGGCKVCREG